MEISWDMSLVNIESPPVRRTYVWKCVCLVTPDSEWIHYHRVEFPESLDSKGCCLFL